MTTIKKFDTNLITTINNNKPIAANTGEEQEVPYKLISWPYAPNTTTTTTIIIIIIIIIKEQ